MRVASPTTWAFVTRSPSSRIRNPEPVVRRGSSGGPGSCPPPAGGGGGRGPTPPPSGASEPPLEPLLSPSIAPPATPLARDFPKEVTQFGEDELLQGKAAGVGRSGEGEDEPALPDPGLGAGEHRRRPDLRVGEQAEELPEPREALVQHAFHRLERRIARGDPGPARQDERLNARIFARPANHVPDLARLVLHDGRLDDLVPGHRQKFPDQLPARVGLGHLRVGDRKHEAGDTLWRPGLVVPWNGRGGSHWGHP